MRWLKWFGIYVLWLSFCIGLGWVFSLTSRLVFEYGWAWWQASLLVMFPLAILGATAMCEIERRAKKAGEK